MKYGFRRAFFILFFLLLLAGIHLYIYTQNITLKYKLTDLKIKLGEIRSKTRFFNSEVARKEQLVHIEKIAVEKLDMVYPPKINYILIPQNNPEQAGKTSP